MKTGLIKLTTVAVMGLLIAQSASALTFNINRTSGYYTGNGGEFTLTGTGLDAGYNPLARGPGGVGIQTFCLELNEYVDIPGGPYTYNGLDSGAIRGGNGGGNPDALSVGTGWLYSQFALGTLPSTLYNYTVGSGRAASAGQLQQAIWWLEEELTGIVPNNNVLLNAAIAQFGSFTLAKASASAGQYGVWAINPYQGSTPKQSQVVFKPIPPVIVADGGLTLLLLGSSLMGLGAVRRFFR